MTPIGKSGTNMEPLQPKLLYRIVLQFILKGCFWRSEYRFWRILQICCTSQEPLCRSIYDASPAIVAPRDGSRVIGSPFPLTAAAYKSSNQRIELGLRFRQIGPSPGRVHNGQSLNGVSSSCLEFGKP